MSTAFVETTVLTDYLLKKDELQRAAASALARFDEVTIPHFAWKELKRGPLRAFVWAHNKLVDTQSIADTMLALQRLSRTPQRYLTSTALQAVHTSFSNAFAGVDLDDLRKRYGSKADLSALLADMMRIELKKVTLSAWSSRKSLSGGPYHILTCYPDEDIRVERSRLNLDPRDCPLDAECCLQVDLSKKKRELAAARAALPDDQREETRRRFKVLRRMEKHPNSLVSRDECRAFGDAYFVIFCPAGAVILTTNMRDIEPMANASGIATERP